MNNKRLMKVFGLLLVIGLITVISPLTRAQARTTDMFSISDWTIDGLVVDDSGRPVISPQSGTPSIDPIDAQNIDEGVELTFVVHATPAGFGILTNLQYSLTGNVPSGATLTKTDNEHATFRWTPTEAQGPGTYNFTVRVCETAGFFQGCATRSVSVTVYEVNVAPVLDEIGDKEVDELDTLEFVAEATDADIPVQTLVFSLAGEVPEGAVITAAGAFSWTPSETQGPGKYTFDVCVSDGALSDCETITVTVNEVNVAPEAVDDEYEILMGEKLEVPAPGVLENDIDPDPSDEQTVEVKDAPLHGELVLNPDGSFTYEPDAGFHGIDTFTYWLISEPGTTAVGPHLDWATVTITVRPVGQTLVLAGDLQIN